MIKYNNYYASELENHAIAITQYQHPNTIQLGDVNDINFKSNKFNQVDLLLAGSPCTSFSMAGKREGFKAESGQLFFRFIDALKTIQPKYFLLENVKMSKDNQDIMIGEVTKAIGYKPYVYFINSSITSPQNRLRMYITNIKIDPSQIVDRKLVIADILEENVDASWNLSDKANERCRTNPRSRAFKIGQKKSGALLANQYKQSTDGLYPISDSTVVGDADKYAHYNYNATKRVYHQNGKAPTLLTMQGGNREPKVATYDPKGGRIVNLRLNANGVRKDNQLDLPFTTQLEVRGDSKTNCLTTVEKDNVVVGDDGLRWRKLLPTEAEALQSLPRDYTSWGSYKIGDNWIHRKPVAKSNRFKAVGNGWTVSVINEIFKGIQGDLRDVLSLFDGISCGQQALKTTNRSN